MPWIKSVVTSVGVGKCPWKNRAAAKTLLTRNFGSKITADMARRTHSECGTIAWLPFFSQRGKGCGWLSNRNAGKGTAKVSGSFDTRFFQSITPQYNQASPPSFGAQGVFYFLIERVRNGIQKCTHSHRHELQNVEQQHSQRWKRWRKVAVPYHFFAKLQRILGTNRRSSLKASIFCERNLFKDTPRRRQILQTWEKYNFYADWKILSSRARPNKKRNSGKVLP